VNNNLAESTVIVFLLFVCCDRSLSSAWWTMGECVFCDKSTAEKQDRNGGKGNKEKDILDKALVSALSVRQHFR
jgi:hypothetical protein